MIAVDTSALIAIVLHEEPGPAGSAAMKKEDRLLISAATVVEALIVAYRRDASEEMLPLLDGVDFDVVPVTADQARRIDDAYVRWGRGAKTGTALPMMSPKRTIVRCCMSDAISPRRMSRARSEESER